MSFNRIRLSREATFKGRAVAGRLGITPNIVYRLGLCLSIEEPSIPNITQYDELGQEINRYTLLGEYDSLFIALIKQRLIHDGFEPLSNIEGHLKAHLNRGVTLLSNRVRDLADLYELMTLPSDRGGNNNTPVHLEKDKIVGAADSHTRGTSHG